MKGTVGSVSMINNRNGSVRKFSTLCLMILVMGCVPKSTYYSVALSEYSATNKYKQYFKREMDSCEITVGTNSHGGSWLNTYLSIKNLSKTTLTFDAKKVSAHLVDGILFKLEDLSIHHTFDPEIIAGQKLDTMKAREIGASKTLSINYSFHSESSSKLEDSLVVNYGSIFEKATGKEIKIGEVKFILPNRM